MHYGPTFTRNWKSGQLWHTLIDCDHENIDRCAKRSRIHAMKTMAAHFCISVEIVNFDKYKQIMQLYYSKNNTKKILKKTKRLKMYFRKLSLKNYLPAVPVVIKKLKESKRGFPGFLREICSSQT